MSDICSIASDHNFDVVMETVCPTSVLKCKWTVKDFTKYPSEEIRSPLFEPSEIDACRFTLRNFASSDASVYPEFCVKYHCINRVYATFKISFYDPNGELLYKMEKTRAFCPPKGRDFQMKDFPQRKVLDMKEDTVIVECEMKMSRPENILQTSEDQSSQSTLATASEDQGSQSSLTTSEDSGI